MKDRRSRRHGGPSAGAERLSAEELYRRHAAYVATFLHRLGVAGPDAADLTQEVFLVVHRKGGYLAGAAKPTTWLSAIAVRVAANHRRAVTRRPISDTDGVERAAAGTSDPERAAVATRALARVQRALDGLDVDHRAVFVLYELEGEPCGAIAEALGVPVGTVYSRLHTARRRFLEQHAREADVRMPRDGTDG